MAVFTSSAFALQRKLIIGALQKCGARIPETANIIGLLPVKNMLYGHL